LRDMGIRVLIADDHNLVREGLATLLSSFSEIEVIGEASDGSDAVSKTKQLKPDLVLMDIAMPGMNGIEATRILKRDCSDIKIVAVSMHSDRHFIKGILEADADGYLLKNCTGKQLAEAVKCAVSGKKYLCEEITDMLIKGYLDPDEENEKGFSELTEREIDIFKLYAEGTTTREIAEKLFISVKTVGTHKLHIYKKLGINNNADIVKYAIKRGLIQF